MPFFWSIGLELLYSGNTDDQYCYNKAILNRLTKKRHCCRVLQLLQPSITLAPYRNPPPMQAQM